MTNQPRNQKGNQQDTSKNRNLILVNNNSDIFQDSGVPNIFSRYSSMGMNENQGNRRQSSISNLFAGFKNEEKAKEQLHRHEEVLSEDQRYTQECLEYEKYLFDDKIKLIIHRMAVRAYQNCKDKNDSSFFSFFIERFICILAKKLLLNRFQLLFLQYVFEESKWKYELDCIETCALDFKSYIHIPESEGNQEDLKNLQIYLLYCAYYSKKSLNQFPQESIFNNFLKSISEKFKEHFNEWTQKSTISSIKINPKLLNMIFKRLTSFQEKDRQNIENYNLLVEEIIDISPAYNADKEGKVKKTKKKNVAEIQKEEERVEYQRESEVNDHDLGMIAVHKDESNEAGEYPIPGFNKKRTSYVSNIDGLDPVAYFNRQPNDR